MFLTQQVFTSIQRCFFNQTTKQDRTRASTDLVMICSTRITFRMVAKGFVGSDGAQDRLWMELVALSLSPSLGWFQGQPSLLIFQAVQNTLKSVLLQHKYGFPKHSICSQKSMEKPEIHGRAASLKKRIKQLCKQCMERVLFPRFGICPITSSFTFQPQYYVTEPHFF